MSVLSCLIKVMLVTHGPSALPQLLETKSTDRKLTLLHYISNVVKEKYPIVSLFYNELHYVEKAAAGEARALFHLSVISYSFFLSFAFSPPRHPPPSLDLPWLLAVFAGEVFCVSLFHLRGLFLHKSIFHSECETFS